MYSRAIWEIIALAIARAAWYYQNRHDTYKVFESWISLKWLCSKVICEQHEPCIRAHAAHSLSDN